MTHTSKLGDPIGAPIPDGWKIPSKPTRSVMAGRYIRLEPLVVAHAEALFDAKRQGPDERNWTYLPYGPFASPADYRNLINGLQRLGDTLFFAIDLIRGNGLIF